MRRWAEGGEEGMGSGCIESLFFGGTGGYAALQCTEEGPGGSLPAWLRGRCGHIPATVCLCLAPLAPRYVSV